MSATATCLPGGRLHLQHGPIDCICRADGDAAEVERAYGQAWRAFQPILADLCRELPCLRAEVSHRRPGGLVAATMHRAVAPFAGQFITPMAAVAGAVADHVLAAMLRGRVLRRCFVNNGGDIAVHLAAGQSMTVAVVTDIAAPRQDATLTLTRPCGIATSGRACKGRGGRSFSFGIADAVSVIAATAASADAAASVIANAVDLPGHPAISRCPAVAIDPDSDLGERLVTTGVDHLTRHEIDAALRAGRRRADVALAAGLIDGAALALRRRMMTAGSPVLALAPALMQQEAA